jgi:hypothetical protein
MPRRRRRHTDWEPWDRPWGTGPGRHRWPGADTPPEEAAEQFAEAAQHVGDKVGKALEQAFARTSERLENGGAEEVGERVASAIGSAIERVSEAIPKPDPEKVQRERDRRLVRRRDRATHKVVLFSFLWVGICSAILLSSGSSGAAGVAVLTAVFGSLIARNVLWRSSHRGAVERAQARLEGREVPSSSADTADDDEEAPTAAPGLVVPQDTEDVEEVSAVELQARQILSLLEEMNDARPEIQRAVDSTVAKARELNRRRARLESILEDPDLARLDERIGTLASQIDTTADDETRAVYERTLEQLRSQAESLADVRVMLERIDAYLNASLQSLRTIHIDLLRLATGDLDDPQQTLQDVSTRASNLSMEIKGVREVVDEVSRSRNAARRDAQRQI